MSRVNFSQIFSVFSKREKAPGTVSKPLTQEFRFRVFQLCADTFADNFYGSSGEFWKELHRNLSYLHGRPSLAGEPMDSARVDALTFLSLCSEEHFFDFIELIFKSSPYDRLLRSFNGVDQFVSDVNDFLRVDDLPYSLTEFVREEVQKENSNGATFTIIETISYPQIIRRDSGAIHQTAIQPTLTLLANPVFKAANSEFLEALNHFRKGEHADCIAKCGSSFESVMKVICDRKKWPYQQSDTAEPLLKTIVDRTKMESFFHQPIMLVATMRNRLSSSHGAGVQVRRVPERRAQFVINATASAILLLVGETNP